MAIRAGVYGSSGRMGSTTVEAIRADPELVLVDPNDAEVVVDFTVAAAAREALPKLAARGVHAVVGTTGFTDDDLLSIQAAFEASFANCLMVPNFAIGAVLMMRFAELAAPWFESSEIIELHHDAKLDKPSGTAKLTAARMHAVNGREVPIHSVRLRGLVAHQEVLLGTEGQTLTIRHDSLDRSSFMPGVVMAVKAISGLPHFSTGLDQVLVA